MQKNYLTELLGFQGFRVVKVEKMQVDGQSEVIMELKRKKVGYVCGGCHRIMRSAYDSSWQQIQHLGLWQHRTFLRFKHYRVNCPSCGIKTEALDFVGIRGPRVTRMLSHMVTELCKVMTIKSVALLEGLSRDTVKAIDKLALQKIQESRCMDGITTLGVDEISVGKGQNYMHLVSALEGPRGPEMLYIGKGRKEKDLKKFWKWFGKERALNVTYAVMDMWKGFIKSFKANCPKVEIIYDKFHIISHLLEALNKVRKNVLQTAEEELREELTGKKFILLSRCAHVRGKAREALSLLLGSSKRLFKAYMLKESFGHLWEYKSKTCARRFFKNWVDSLKWSRLPSYKKFASMVEKHLDGILACCDKKVSLGYIEASNLKARNIIRRAYGYRDREYMNLKIIQGCTHWMIQFRPWEFTHTMSS
ncbi:MAG: ISL3 family transposase [Nanoarchaeota archaeon]